MTGRLCGVRKQFLLIYLLISNEDFVLRLSLKMNDCVMISRCLKMKKPFHKIEQRISEERTIEALRSKYFLKKLSFK